MNIRVLKTELQKDDGQDQVIQPMADACGAQLQIQYVSSTLHPCTGCGKCMRTHTCTIDDELQDIITAIDESDGVLFLTSLLYGCPCETFISLVKRICTSRPDVLRQKPVSVMGICRSSNTSMDLSEISSLLNAAAMVRIYGPYGMVLSSTMHDEDTIRLRTAFANLLWASSQLKNGRPALEAMPKAPYRIR